MLNSYFNCMIVFAFPVRGITASFFFLNFNYLKRKYIIEFVNIVMFKKGKCAEDIFAR